MKQLKQIKQSLEESCIVFGEVFLALIVMSFFTDHLDLSNKNNETKFLYIVMFIGMTIVNYRRITKKKLLKKEK